MTTEISGLGVGSVAEVSPTTRTAATVDAEDASSAVEDSVSIDLQSAAGSPPPEVTAAIDQASKVYDQLEAAGQHVEFAQDPDTGEPSAQLRNPDGTTQSLSMSEVLNLADGNGRD